MNNDDKVIIFSGEWQPIIEETDTIDPLVVFGGYRVFGNWNIRTGISSYVAKNTDFTHFVRLPEPPEGR